MFGSNYPKRIGIVSKIGLYASALVFDLVQILLDFIAVGAILGTIITAFAWIMYFIWFKILGVPFTIGSGSNSSRRSIAFFAGGIGEMIPLINALPMWTISIAIIISATNKEDAEVAKKNKAKTNSSQKNTPEETNLEVSGTNNSAIRDIRTIAPDVKDSEQYEEAKHISEKMLELKTIPSIAPNNNQNA